MKKANMQTSIQKLPDVLILHLKRLVMNTKIRTLVKFPFNDLDLADFLTGKPQPASLLSAVTGAYLTLFLFGS
jgi:hypothetical protein